jgi:hypothetical protein
MARASSSWTTVCLAHGFADSVHNSHHGRPITPQKGSGMALFSNLLSRIWGHADTAAPTAASTVGVPAATPASAAPAVPAPPASPVDVAAVLNGLAATHAERLDWQHSIVDLLKLVGMDSSLAARKELATDLHYTGALDGSAAMNLWLHKEVMKKLAENGGKVPQALLD